jgi:hypothetical protein
MQVLTYIYVFTVWVRRNHIASGRPAVRAQPLARRCARVPHPRYGRCGNRKPVYALASVGANKRGEKSSALARVAHSPGGKRLRQRTNILFRHAPILASAPFNFFVVDSYAEPLKATLLPAALGPEILVDVSLDQDDAVEIIRSRQNAQRIHVCSEPIHLPAFRLICVDGTMRSAKGMVKFLQYAQGLRSIWLDQIYTKLARHLRTIKASRFCSPASIAI